MKEKKKKNTNRENRNSEKEGKRENRVKKTKRKRTIVWLDPRGFKIQLLIPARVPSEHSARECASRVRE